MVNPSESPNPGNIDFCLSVIVLLWLIHLIENSAVGEVNFLCLVPVASDFGKREQLHSWKLTGILLGDSIRPRAVVPLGSDLLSIRTVEIVKISLRDRTSSLLVHHFIHEADGWFAKNADGGNNDFELILAKVSCTEQDFVFPCDQDVSHSALHKCCGGSARTRIEHWNVLIEPSDKVLGFGFIPPRFLKRISPCSQVVPACTARGLGIGSNDRDARSNEILPIFDALRIPFANEEDDGRSVGRTVVGQQRLPVSGKQFCLFRDGVNIVSQSKSDHV